MHSLRAKAGLWAFFGFVFCWTWCFWGVAVWRGASVQSFEGEALLRLGLLGPMLGGIAFAWLNHDAGYWRDYWLRIVEVRRIPPRWWAVILLFVPVLILLALALDAFGSGQVTLELIRRRVGPFLAAPWLLVPAMLAVFINGPLPEELGWRGYALDQLQARWSAAIASLVLGAIWAVWHLPLFVMTGMVHASQGLGWRALFFVNVIAMAFVLTWIFNNTRRSTLGAILFHFMANVSFGLGNVSDGTNLYATLLLAAVALALAYRGVGAKA